MNKNKIAVSVIIPVYNSEKYLIDKVKSVLNQTLKDIEIILVDDGSKDTSPKICDELSHKYDKIVVVHQENMGICKARNNGLDIARGRYIAFCDNDDFMVKDCLSKSVEAIEKDNADFVRFRRRHSLKKRWITIGANYPKFDNYIIKGLNWDDYIKAIENCGYGVWAGIYKKEFIDKHDIKFSVEFKYGYEDHMFVAECFKYANSVAVINDVLYIWKQRKGNSTSCKVGTDIYKNRIKSIFKWISVEEQIAELTQCSDFRFNERKYDYMECILNEIFEQKNNDYSIWAKEYYQRLVLEPSKSSGYKKYRNNAIYREDYRGYHKILLIHKILLVLFGQK